MLNIFNIISANQNVNITHTQHISIYKILMMQIMQENLMYGEYISAAKFQNMIKEMMMMKVSLYNLFRKRMA